jgi:hypothetical protein
MTENYRAHRAKTKAYRENFTGIDWSGARRARKATAEKQNSHVILHDIEPFQTIEGEVITSRSSLREYEKRKGVRQCGNDWTSSEKPAGWDGKETVSY